MVIDRLFSALVLKLVKNSIFLLSFFGMIFRIGMVSQEEYEYSAFKCAFCKALNPSKKLRPIAPRLPMPVLSEPSDTSNKKIAEKPAQLPVPDKESGNFAHFDNSN